jgi:hypothetical protein
MSKLLHWLARLLASLAGPRAESPDLDAMPTRDWADLPAYHPIVDRTPC